MNMKTVRRGLAAAAALSAAIALAQDADGSATKTTGTSVVTNSNGTVTRTFTETNVATNGNMETKKVRITTTTLDPEGNVIGTSTMERSESKSEGARYWTLGGDDDWDAAGGGVTTIRLPHMALSSHGRLLSSPLMTTSSATTSKRGDDLAGSVNVSGSGVIKFHGNEEKAEEPAKKEDFSFLGVKFGETLESQPSEIKILDVPRKPGEALTGIPTMGFKDVYIWPPKSLAGFDRCLVLLTPKTGKVARLIVGATVDGNKDDLNDYDYMREALERKYGKPTETNDMRLRLRRPYPKWTWDLGNGRMVELGFRQYGCRAMVTVTDLDVVKEGDKEGYEIEKEERKAADEEARRRLDEAVEAF